MNDWREHPFGSQTFPRVPRSGLYRGQVCCEHTFFAARIRYIDHFERSLIDLDLEDGVPPKAVCDLASDDALSLYQDPESGNYGSWAMVDLGVLDRVDEELQIGVAIVWDADWGRTPLSGGLMVTTFVSEDGPPDHWVEMF